MNTEISSHAAKRKKRRTRKCLDEIRKRSLRSTFCDLIPNDAVSSKQTKKIESRALFAITSKRLTLQPHCFSKAVKSETVTRPLIAAAPETEEFCVYNGFNSRNVEKKLEHENNYCQAESLHNQSASENAGNDDNVSNEQLDSQPECFNILCSPEAAPSTSASSQNPLQDCGGYQLYAQFLKELPFHIERNSPDLINKNIMKKTKTFLQNVYTEGCRRKSRKRISTCANDTTESLIRSKECHKSKPSDIIIQNPIDYIKMSVVRNQECQQEDSSTYSPCSPALPLEVSPLAVIQDTPEYTFYPRKLNWSLHVKKEEFK